MEKSDVVGMGIRTTTALGEIIEGDLVTTVPGGLRFIDFKASYPAGVSYDLDQLERVKDALKDGRIVEAVYAIEAGTTPDPAWLNQLAQHNNFLLSQNLNPILLGTVGSF